jgi:hypothetical protein
VLSGDSELAHAPTETEDPSDRADFIGDRAWLAAVVSRPRIPRRAPTDLAVLARPQSTDPSDSSPTSLHVRFPQWLLGRISTNSELRNHGVIPARTPKPRRIRLGEHAGIKPEAPPSIALKPGSPDETHGHPARSMQIGQE